MTDPPRLFDATDDSFERRLLRSARHDCGSHAAQARCLATASAAAIAASKLSMAAATTGAAVTTGAAATAGSAVAGTSILIKAVAIGLTVGLAAQGFYVVGERVLSHDSTAPTGRAAPPLIRSVASEDPVRSTSVPSPEPPLELTLEPPRPSVTAAPSSIRSVARQPAGSAAHTEQHAPQPTASIAASPSDNSLEREVSLLDDARHACRVGANELALQLLDQHATAFPSGTLGPEAVVIRVQALLGLGRRSDAEAMAKKYIAFHANSATAKRLEMLVESNSK